MSTAYASELKRNHVPRAHNFRDLTGRVYGMLTVEEYAGTRRQRSYWHCRCECGCATTVCGIDLNLGTTLSCGCLRASRTSRRNLERRGHGENNRNSLEYRTWTSMKSRCQNPNNRKFDDYAGRGIGICDRWNDSFEAFLADMGRRPSPDHSIDRIDNNGDYEPGNCRWATSSQQNLNRRKMRPRRRKGTNGS